MRIALPGLVLYFFFAGILIAHASAVDSVHTIVSPVQCYGLRNGMIRVDTVFGGEKPFFYSLDGLSFTTNPTFDHLKGGEYRLYVRDASGGMNNWPIIVAEPSELQVKLLASEKSVVAGIPIDLRAIMNVPAEAIHDIQWRPTGLFPKQDTFRQQVILAESTQFSVMIHDQNGCSASDELSVVVEKTNLYLPNVIKPGSASDAYFTVFAGEGVRKVVSLQIYSRAGSLIFERLDFPPNAPSLGWGGRWNNEWAQAGVYLFVTLVECADGKQLRTEGTVTVVR